MHTCKNVFVTDGACMTSVATLGQARGIGNSPPGVEPRAIG